VRFYILLIGILGLFGSEPATAANIVVAFGNGYDLGTFEYDPDSPPTRRESWLEGTEAEIYETGQLKALSLIGSDGMLHSFPLNEYGMIQTYRAGDFMLFNLVAFSQASGYVSMAVQMYENPKTSANLPKYFNDKYIDASMYINGPDGSYDYSITTFNIQQASAVPEPGTWVSLFAGFGVIGGIARCRRRNRKWPQKSAIFSGAAVSHD